MALGEMKFVRNSVGVAPEILYNSEYVGDAITLDTAAFSDGVCKAGTPIGAGGVIANSADIEDLVQTSLNLGILKMQDEEVILQFSVRSSLESEKKMLGQKLDVVTKLVGGYTVISGEYPGWAYKEDSYLREHMKKVYAEMFGKDLNIVAIHAGLECGIFAGKLNGLDSIVDVSKGSAVLNNNSARFFKLNR